MKLTTLLLFALTLSAEPARLHKPTGDSCSGAPKNAIGGQRYKELCVYDGQRWVSLADPCAKAPKNPIGGQTYLSIGTNGSTLCYYSALDKRWLRVEDAGTDGGAVDDALPPTINPTFYPVDRTPLGKVVPTYRAVRDSRNVSIGGNFYIVDYEYIPSGVRIPATIPPGGREYDASITVSEVINGEPRIVQTFTGVYIESERFLEDDAFERVYHALEDTGKLTPDLKRLFESRAKAIVYEAMPPYEASGGVLTITEKGTHELCIVRVMDHVVWESGSEVCKSRSVVK